MIFRKFLKSWTWCFVLIIFAAPVQGVVNEWTGAGGSSNWVQIAGWSQGYVPVNGEDVVISASIILSNTTVQLSSFTNNATITFSGTNTTLFATNVFVGATVTHYPQSATATNAQGEWVMDNRIWISCSNLTLLNGKSIDVDGKGYDGGRGPGAGSGATAVAASHGGKGYASTAGSTYGSSSAPVEPGSGGANSTSGGDGGGVVKIEADGCVTINGTISADGLQSGTPHRGAGSGGSVWIQCRTIEGSGDVTASGGTGNQTGRASGGGRIAIQYDAAAQAGATAPTITFAAGGGRFSGGDAYPGTVYLTDSTFYPYEVLSTDGIIIIPTFTNWSGSSFTIDNAWVQISGLARMDLTGTLKVTGTYGILDYSNGVYSVINCSALTVTNGGSLNLWSGVTNGVAPDHGTLVTIGGTLAVAENSAVHIYSQPANGGSALWRVRSLRVDINGEFDADGGGYAGGQGRGAGWGTYGGGSYGGLGGGKSGPTYGISNAPADPGSGGYSGTGGTGGGVVRIEATKDVVINGTVSANGASGGIHRGGGAGGSVWIQTSRFSGTGTISSLGADGVQAGNGGGGGRIAIWCTYTNTWGGSLTYPDSVLGAEGSGSGTIVWVHVPASGTVIVIR